MSGSKLAGGIRSARSTRCGDGNSKAKPSLSSTKVPLRWLAGTNCIGMLLVLVMGAAVTNTGSAEGCGRSWPLCNGQFVPEFTVATAIEYSHRAVTGLGGVLVPRISRVL